MIDITIVDNILPLSLANDLENILLSKSHPWYFIPDITHGHDTYKTDNSIPGYKHAYFDVAYGGMLSTYFGYFHSIPSIIFDKIGYKNRPELMRIYSFMQLPLIRPEDYLHDNLHIDYDNVPHIVCLYYVNDTDGDTFIYDINKKMRRISPKKNRAVIFDGSLYHASSLPTKNKRVIINFNVEHSIVTV